LPGAGFVVGYETVKQICVHCETAYHSIEKGSVYCSLACFHAARSLLKRRLESVKARFEKNFIVTPGCWLWQSLKMKKGYGRMHCFGGMNLAHRISYQLYVEDIPDDICVLHRCDTPSCVNPDHLFLGTLADNNQDKAKKGRAPRGETHPLAKFTEAQIRSIYLDARPYNLIVSDYGISKPHISGIKSGKFWVHVTGQASHG
jgi:hypothetical protein